MPRPCQMPGSYADADPQTRRGEWERLSCVVGVLERTGLGILGRYQVYVTIIRSNIDDLQTKKRRKNGAYAPILLRNKTETFCPPLRTSVLPPYSLVLYQSTMAPSDAH